MKHSWQANFFVCADSQLESYLIAFDVYDDGASNRETTVSKTKDDHVIDVDQEPGKFNKKKMLSMKSAFMENGI